MSQWATVHTHLNTGLTWTPNELVDDSLRCLGWPLAILIVPGGEGMFIGRGGGVGDLERRDAPDIEDTAVHVGIQCVSVCVCVCAMWGSSVCVWVCAMWGVFSVCVCAMWGPQCVCVCVCVQCGGHQCVCVCNVGGLYIHYWKTI